MVTAAAPHSAALREPVAVDVIPTALTQASPVTFDSILQGLPFVPGEASAAAGQTSGNSNVATDKKSGNPTNASLAGTAAARTELRAWTSTPPAYQVPQTSATEFSTARNRAVSAVLSARQQNHQTEEPASAAPARAGLFSATKASISVRQPLVQAETAVNITQVQDTVSSRLPAVQGPAEPHSVPSFGSTSAPQQHSAAPASQGTPSFNQPRAPQQHSAALASQDTPSFNRPAVPQQHSAALTSQDTPSFSQPTAPQRYASLPASHPTPSADQPMAPRNQSVATALSTTTLTRTPEASSAPVDPARNSSPIVATPAPIPLETQAAASHADDDSKQAAGDPQRSSVPGSLVQAEVDSVVNNRAQAISVTPRNENLAFSLKMSQNDTATQRTQPAPQPVPARNDASSNTKGDARAAGMPAATNAAHEPTIVKAEAQPAVQATNTVWSETGLVANVTPRAEIQLEGQPRSIETNAPTAAHEVAAMPPEPPRPNAASEILLQLGGKDQPATVRVLDRAGTVNVSVHAADPDLRASLRSNLGDLASQLAHQGWKTEVAKTGTGLTPSESSRDSSSDGQRGGSQQHASSQGERQPHKERRGSGGQWLAQFEESLSQNSSNSGGTN